MSRIIIAKRWTGETLWEGEAESLREAVIKAVSARANLTGACLAGADLADADLAGANLADANLADANLTGACLAGADLAGANLADADLAGANLADANLADANLTGANLAGADLAGAYLTGACLAGADLARANLAGANLADANLADAYLARADLARANLARANLADAKWGDLVGVPVIENLDTKILQAVETPGNALNMGDWHLCETTHCRAGWAVHLAGAAGYELEKKVGPAIAGTLIYVASGKPVPDFYADTDEALASIRKGARLEAEAEAVTAKTGDVS